MSHSSLANYYTTMFAMVNHHKYSISDLENIFPFERDIYVEMLLEYLDEKKKQLERENAPT